MKIYAMLFLAMAFGAFVQAETPKNSEEMYTYKQIGNKYVVSINNREEIAKALADFCERLKIKSGSICGIGAVNEAVLRFFDPQTKKYEDKTFKEQMEISNLTGNISTMNGKTYLHLHITLGRRDYSALAGHLLSAKLNGAGEFVVEDFGENIERKHSPEIGLNIYDFKKRPAQEQDKN